MGTHTHTHTPIVNSSFDETRCHLVVCVLKSAKAQSHPGDTAWYRSQLGYSGILSPTVAWERHFVYKLLEKTTISGREPAWLGSPQTRQTHSVWMHYGIGWACSH